MTLSSFRMTFHYSTFDKDRCRTHKLHEAQNPSIFGLFLAWTFGISWGSWLLLYVLATLKLTSGSSAGFALLLIGGFGPTGNFISLKISFDPKKMLDFIFSHAKDWWIYMLAFCLVRV